MKSYFSGPSLPQCWQQRKRGQHVRKYLKQLARTTRETKQPRGTEAGAQLNSTPQDSHEKFSNSIQGHVWCLLCPQTSPVTEAATEAEQSCNTCGCGDALSAQSQDTPQLQQIVFSWQRSQSSTASKTVSITIIYNNKDCRESTKALHLSKLWL